MYATHMTTAEHHRLLTASPREFQYEEHTFLLRNLLTTRPKANRTSHIKKKFMLILTKIKRLC